MQKKEKASITLSLHQEIEREAREIEKEIAQHPELDQIQVTEKMDKALLEKIRAYEKEVEEGECSAKKAEKTSRKLRDGIAADAGMDGSGGSGRKDTTEAVELYGKFSGPEKDVEFSNELVPDLEEIRMRRNGRDRKYREDDESRKVVYRRKKKKYWIVSLAAVLVIVLGVGMNSVGSKSYWKRLREIFVGEAPVKVINVEDMNGQNTEDVDELAVYGEIHEKFNFKPVRLIYKPDKMKLEDYEIYEDILTAQLLYKYHGETIKYIFYVNDEDSSWGQKEEDNEINEYTVLASGMEIKVSEFLVLDSSENRQIANFEYKGVRYQLKGVMKRSEFEKILQNLYFF